MMVIRIGNGRTEFTIHRYRFDGDGYGGFDCYGELSIGQVIRIIDEELRIDKTVRIVERGESINSYRFVEESTSSPLSSSISKDSNFYLTEFVKEKISYIDWGMVREVESKYRSRDNNDRYLEITLVMMNQEFIEGSMTIEIELEKEEDRKVVETIIDQVWKGKV